MKTPRNCVIKAIYGDGTINYFRNKTGHDFRGYKTKEGKNVYRRLFLIEYYFLKLTKKIKL